jgi:FkbM family methyltransferase
MTSLAEDLRFLARSRSLRLLTDRRRAYRPGTLGSYRWRGIDLAYRPGSSDVELIHEILLRGREGEYAIPPGWGYDPGAVRAVLDIGANIGIAAVYLASIFPNARVFAFEPVAENLELLRKNTRSLPRIATIEAALGAADGERRLYSSIVPTNFGGFSLYEPGSDVRSSRTVRVHNAQRMADRLGIGGAEVIKLDTEGAEWEILTALSPQFLGSTQLIFGELHGERDGELLGFLSDRFDVGTRPQVGGRRSNFCAVRRPSSSP